MTRQTSLFGVAIRASLPALCITLLAPRAAFADPPAVPAIVFVSRDFQAAPDLARRATAVERARTGKLLVREVDSQVRALVDATLVNAPSIAPVDVADPDVSFDGSKIVFAGFSPSEQAWRVFEIQADGSSLRQITRSDRAMSLERYGAAADLFGAYDDVDPCYLPDGRICFVSTRYPGVAPDGRMLATNLYVVNGDGSALHRITSERFGADTPTVEPATGRIIYSRWWRTVQAIVDPTEEPEPIPPGSPGYAEIAVDESVLVLRGIADTSFPGVNSWFLAGINPDGTDLAMWSGFRLDRELTQAYRPAFLESGEALALFIPQTPFLGFPRGNGLRRFSKGPSSPASLGGPQTFPKLTADGKLDQPIKPFVYASAAALSNGQMLVTAATPQSLPLGYGIYVQANVEELPVLLYDAPLSAELDAVALAPRTLPPLVADRNQTLLVEEAPRTVDEAFAYGDKFTFKVENIFANTSVGVPMPNAPPVGHKLAIEFYMSPQRTSTGASDPPILIRSEPIPRDGKIEVELPAGVPLFEVLRRSDGSIPLGRDGQIFHVGGMNFGRAGETARCVGCHTGHSQMAVPEDATFSNLAPSAFVSASSERTLGRNPPLNLPADSPLLKEAFRAFNLVDRRLDGMGSEWSSWEAGPAVNATLRWSTTLRAKEVVVYGTTPGAGISGERSQRIKALNISTSLRGTANQSIDVTGDIAPSGTRAALDPQIDFDALRVSIRSQDVVGLYEGSNGAALAEIEVIARATGDPAPIFSRGDVDLNNAIQLTDSIRILGFLFLGSPAPPCLSAADTNDDGVVNISDSIFQLGFLFLGAAVIPPPFQSCGSDPTPDGLECETSGCF